MGKKKPEEPLKIKKHKAETHAKFGIAGKGRARVFKDKKKEEDKKGSRKEIEEEELE